MLPALRSMRNSVMTRTLLSSTSRAEAKFGPDLVADARRILGKLARNEQGCWEWQGSLDTHGYAQTRIGSSLDGSRRMVLVHRWVHERLVGPIPDDLVVDHLCENRKCANPGHFNITTSVLNAARQDYSKRRRKTHCKHGHDLSDAWVGSNGRRRYCRQCNLRRMRERQARRVAAREVAA